MIADRYAPLYPASAWRLPVIERLPVPRRHNVPPAAPNAVGFREYYHPNILGEGSCAGTGELMAFIDKAFPHTRYDLMLLLANDDVRTGVGDVSVSTLRCMFKVIAAFVRYISTDSVVRRFDLERSTLTVGCNYDRATRDRASGQWWDKRLHWHMNVWPEQDCQGYPVVELGMVSNDELRRSLVDPITFLATDIIGAALRGRLDGVTVLEPDVDRDLREHLPPGLKIRIPGLSFLETEDCTHLVRKLHSAASSVYRVLRECFTGSVDTLPVWHRPRLLDELDVEANLAEVPWLPDKNRRQLMTLRRLLRDVSPGQMDALRRRPRAARGLLSLAGLDYHMGFYTPQLISADRPLWEATEVYLFMQFKLFGAIGSNPTVAGAVAANLDRDGGRAMSGTELELRRAFQLGLLERVRPWFEEGLVDALPAAF